MWLKGAIVDVGLDATSVDVLCMVLDLDYDRAVSTNQLKHWRKGLLATAQRNALSFSAARALSAARRATRASCFASLSSCDLLRGLDPAPAGCSAAS